MSLLSIFGIAIALAMDAFAVSLSTGIRLQNMNPGQTLRMAGVFGGFQFLMPIIGWLLGIGAQEYIERYDHWLAFGLLAFVGCHMLKEAWDNRGTKEDDSSPNPTKGKSLWLLGIATSIDALAVGLSLAMLKVAVWFPAVIIGIVCFIITIIGLYMGRLIRRIPGLDCVGNKAHALGGLVLLIIGFKILYDHGVFS